MTDNYYISSLINRFNLGKKHNKQYFIIEKTRNIEIILKLFFKENLISNYLHHKNYFIVFLKYNSNFLIKYVKIGSRPGKRLYISLYKLKSLIHQNPLSFFVLSTTSGILHSRDALKLNIGGELLFKLTF